MKSYLRVVGLSLEQHRAAAGGARGGGGGGGGSDAVAAACFWCYGHDVADR